MKKTFISALLLGSMSMALMADWDMHGQITAVNPTDKTITIQGMGGAATIQILPYTELKGDDCGPWGNDIYGTFKDLTIGKFIEAEVYPANTAMNATTPQNMPAVAKGTQFIAKEIEWKCRPMAY